jgi:predicted MPP superfamily phosphohydrolase
MSRIIIVVLFLLAVDYYALQALKQTDWGRTKIFQLLYGLFSFFTMAGFIAVLMKWPEELPIDSNMISYFGGYLFIFYFSKFIVIFPLLIDDMRRLILFFSRRLRNTTDDTYWPSRSAFLSKLGLVLGGIPAFVLTYGIVRNPFRFQLRSESIPVKNLPTSLEGLKIVQISDLHSGTFNNSQPFEDAIQLVNNQNPDIVGFTGDLVNNIASEATTFVSLFSKIKSKYGIYSILGNHDYGDYYDWLNEEQKRDNFDLLQKYHRSMGWDLLLDDARQLEIDGFKINIIGVENISALSHFPVYGDLSKAWAKTPKGDYNILLSHDPTHWDSEVVVDYKDIDLTLSGHTHGFQFGIEIPGYIRWSPSQWVYRRWAGLYKEKNQYLYVNRGLGCLGYPGRVGILPEITSIKLTKA